MQIAMAEPVGRFPIITFRKKRLTVAIHAQFDMECAEDAAAVKQMIEEAALRLLSEGQAKIAYSVADL
jgi:copper homeostasis protein CutC